MKVGSLIPIRLGSERLPGKALIEVAGMPLVCHLLDRVFNCKYINDKEDVIVCTTKETPDDELVRVVEDYGASIYRGSTDDIIKRFYDAANEYELDYILQVDGDDILCATEYMDLTLESLLNDNSLDIVTCEGIPFGTASKSFTKNAMDRVFDYYKTNENDTGFIYYFTKTGLCTQKIIHPISDKHILNEVRLTLDYPVDLEVFTIIIKHFTETNKLFNLDGIVSFLQKNPEIMKINSGLDEEYWQRTKEKAQLTYIDSNGNLAKINV